MENVVLKLIFFEDLKLLGKLTQYIYQMIEMLENSIVVHILLDNKRNIKLLYFADIWVKRMIIYQLK
jgi:hypothetical protein